MGLVIETGVEVGRVDTDGDVGGRGGPDFISVRVTAADSAVLGLEFCRGDGDSADPDAEVECGHYSLGFIGFRRSRDDSRVEVYEGELEDELKEPEARGVRDALRRLVERTASNYFELARISDKRGEASRPSAAASEFKPPTEKQAALMLRKAVQEFGTTASLHDAGYLLPDGSMLDFSEGGGMGRTLDHRSIEQVLSPAVAKRYENIYGGRSKAMAFFMATGAIRLLASGDELGLDLVVQPTSDQWRELAQWFELFETVYVDITDLDATTNASMRFDARVAARGAAEAWVDKQFGIEVEDDEEKGWLGGVRRDAAWAAAELADEFTYLSVAGVGLLAVVRVPARGARWRDIRKALGALVRAHGGRLIDASVDGLVSARVADRDSDDNAFVARLELVYSSGSSDVLPKFDFYDWRAGQFQRVRAAQVRP